MTDHTQTETDIAAARARDDFRAMVQTLLSGYGAQLLGFLHATLRDETLADDAFSLFSENLWRGAPGFRGECSARVWAYTLARHAAIRVATDPHRRRARNVELGDHLSDLVARVRTETRPYIRTENKSRIEALRARLSTEERTLLILRIDKAMTWNEIARILAGGDGSLERDAARLRKRFQLVTRKLRRWAEEEGLV